jgi:hypothetical protein
MGNEIEYDEDGNPITCACETLAARKIVDLLEYVCAMHKATRAFTWTSPVERARRGFEYTTNPETCP